MKKALWIVAAATLFFSCQKEQEAVTPDAKSFTFKASIEKLAADTKADMDSEYGLMWAEGDKIGIGVSGWDNNQPFVLQSVSGDDYGSFEWEYYPGEAGDIDKIKADAYAAFFPWQGAGSDVNNVYEDVVYFKMPSYYEHYTSGQMLTPLVAPVTSGEIDFMHAGAAVQVTITNLPAGSHSIAMAADQQIFGDYHIAVSDAGDAAMALDGEAQTTYNSIWLNYDAASEEREFTFLFPTPPMTTPKLSFIIYDENGIMVWNKNLKAQTVSPGRGQVLVMPELTIEPYEQFTNVSAEWTVIGTANGSGWDEDFPMVTDGTICIAKGLYFAEDGSFKVRKNGSWDESYPTAGNWNIWEGEGLYDVIFNTSTKELKAVKSNCPYPTAEYAETHHCSSITNAKDLGKTETANCYVITKAGSYKIPCVKGNSNESAGNRASVQLLWETYNNNQNVTANSIIAAVDYDYRDNYVYFKTPATLQPGNALIAAKDADGNIIWSWHIWIPATELSDVGVYSLSKKYLMDRNLGAIVATEVPTSGTIDIRSVGLYYEWGRKDPFVGYKWGNPDIEVGTSGAAGRNVTKLDAAISVEESIAAPTSFVKGGNWSTSTAVDLWGAGADKSIYDPCPAGYRVPSYDTTDGLWQNVTALSDFSASASAFYWKVGDAVFPMSGRLYYSSGNIDHASDRCWLWSSKSMTGDYVAYGEAQYVYDNSGTWASQPSWGLQKCTGASVRCVKIVGEVPLFSPAEKANAEDKSSEKSANCYVITAETSNASKLFKFRTVQGNSNESVGSAVTASVLWETWNNGETVTAKSVIDAVEYDEGYVYFKMPATPHAGNALIAVKDSQGTILWSWHIWVPATAVSSIAAGIHTTDVMDRNLGALDVTVASATANIDITTVGMYYQWGRKDPFVGPREISEGAYVSKATVSGTEWTAEKRQLSIAESIQNPTLFARGAYENSVQTNPDWCSTSSAEYWGDSGSKSIYDPCPIGYRVPKRDSGKALWATDITTAANWEYSTDHYWFKLGNPATVFPAVGWYDGGSIKTSFRTGIWNAHSDSWVNNDSTDTITDGIDHYAGYARRLYIDGGFKQKTSSVYKSLGYSVRCVKE